MRVMREPFDSPDSLRLREQQRRELDLRYGNDDHEPGSAPSAQDIAVFLVARDEQGTAMACGGLRLLGPDEAEIKRMYVEPSARGSGVAALVLRRLEEEARGRNVHRLVLETGTLQPEAIRFYQREGYRPIAAFGPYVGAEQSLCFGRAL